MAKNEAKIKFTAETGEFNNAIKKANDEMSELRAELKLNETQMQSTGSSVEALKKQHNLLESQLKASQSKTEALAAKVEKAAAIYGENSTEVTKLKTQLANAQTAEEKIKQAIEKCNNELDKQTREAKEAESATKQLTDTIGKQEKQLNDLKAEYSEAVLKYGSTSKEAKALGKEIGTLSSDLKENKDKLQKATDGAEKFDKSLDDVGNTSESVDGKLGKLAIGVAAVGTAMVAAGKEAIEAFNEVDEGADNVIKATGATGEAAAELEESYKKVASSVVGDFDNIGSTLGEVNTRFGYTGSEVEEATTKFLQFSEITGVDSVTAVQAVSRALNDAGIPLDEYDTLLDQLAKAGQTAGIDVTTLADSLSANGSIMRSMGFDTQETIALLSQFELSGANTSVMLTGMKKAMAEWADSGKDGGTEFAKMVKGIKNGSVSAADAIDVFGTKAGPMLVEAIQSGKFEYEDMLDVIQGSEGTLENTFDATIDGGYELELAMQNAKMALAEAGGELGTALTPAFNAFSENVLPAATKAIGAMVDGISSAVGWMKEHKGVVIAVASVIGILTTAITAYNIVQGIKTAMDAANVTTVWGLVAAHWAQATAAMAALAPYILIVAAIAAVIAIVIVCIKYWDEISAAVVAAAKTIWEAIKKAWNWIVELFKDFGEWVNTNVIQPVVGFFTGLWDKIVSSCKAAWDWVKSIFSTFVSWIDTTIIQPIVNFFTGLWESIKTVWDNICNAVQVAVMFIGSIISAAVNIITLPFQFIWENCKQYVFAAWDWIKNAVSTAINAVKTTITNVMNAIKSFLSPILESIKSAFSTAWNAIKTAVSTVLNAIKSVVTTVWNAIKSAVTTVMNAIKSAISTAWNAIKSVVTTVVNAVKSAVSTAWNAIKTAVTNVMNGIKSGVSTAWNAIKSTVSNVVNGIKNTVSNVFNSVKSTVSRVWESIKSAIEKPINKAKETVKKVVDSIKGFFDKLKIKFPNIKLPHFKVTGKFSLDPPSVPKLGIEWYAKAVSSPMILNSPTIFGASNGKLLGGGEAGSEMIGGTNTIMQMIQSAVDKSMQAMNLNSLAAAIEDLANRPISLDINGRQFALATAGDSDRVNGMRNRIIERGVLLD